MRRILCAAVLALGLTLTACGSTTSTARPGAHPSGRVTGVSGIEVITGTATGKAALANTPVIPLAFRGPVTTTYSKFVLGAGKKKTGTFRTPAGNLAVTHSKAKGGLKVTASGARLCLFRQVSRGTYTVVGAKSTGKFAGAAGRGTYVVTFTARAKRLSAAKPCSTANSGNPVAAGASIVFLASGTLIVK